VHGNETQRKQQAAMKILYGILSPANSKTKRVVKE
jgi:hypothetical protein